MTLVAIVVTRKIVLEQAERTIAQQALHHDQAGGDADQADEHMNQGEGRERHAENHVLTPSPYAVPEEPA